MSLHTLPTELLHQITSTFSPHEIHSLLLTNRQLARALGSTSLIDSVFRHRLQGPACNLLYHSAALGNTEITNQLLSRGILKNTGEEAILEAIFHQSEDVIEGLLASDARLAERENEKCRTALHLAVIHSRLGIVRILLESERISVNHFDYDGNTALAIAAQMDDIELVRTLLEDGRVNANAYGDADVSRTPLQAAAEYGHRETVKLLVNCPRVFLNTRNVESGYTAFHFAVMRDQEEVIEFLLEDERTNVNLADYSGWRPLHTAVSERHYDILRMLVAHERISVNETTYMGKTALHIAASNEDSYCVETLLEAEGILVNERYQRGLTPLACAEDEDIQEMLCESMNHC